MTGAHAFRISVCAAAFVMLSVAASQVSAQTTYTIGIDNVSGFSGPFATATVTLNTSTSATVTFTTAANGNGGLNAYLMGDGGAVAVNVNGTATVSGITTGNSLPGGGFATPSPGSGGAGNEDGFGSFNVTINNGAGFASAVTTETFTLTATGTTTWANSASVLTPNSQGNTVAIHLFVCSQPDATCTGSSGATITGFASNGTAAVPEPASMLLFGSGLVALGIRLRRKTRKNEVAA